MTKLYKYNGHLVLILLASGLFVSQHSLASHSMIPQQGQTIPRPPLPTDPRSPAVPNVSTNDVQSNTNNVSTRANKQPNSQPSSMRNTMSGANNQRSHIAETMSDANVISNTDPILQGHMQTPPTTPTSGRILGRPTSDQPSNNQFR